MKQICERSDMPATTTIYTWMEQHPDFAARCAHAREAQADLMDELILEVANNSTPETAQSDRVKLAAYQWRAEKLKPRVYGTRVQQELTGADGGPVQVAAVDFRGLSQVELAQTKALLAKAAKAE